jgi:nicotinamide phosphoribosyltransferase
VTDSGSKKSASGLLKVESVANGGFVVRENCSWLEEDQGELKTVFEGGDAVGFQTYDEICARVAANF